MKNTLLVLLGAACLLAGCGLKGDLYLEEDPDASLAEQEQSEFLEGSVREESEEIDPEERILEDEAEDILGDSD